MVSSLAFSWPLFTLPSFPGAVHPNVTSVTDDHNSVTLHQSSVESRGFGSPSCLAGQPVRCCKVKCDGFHGLMVWKLRPQLKISGATPFPP